MTHIPAKTPHQLNVRWSTSDIWEIRMISEAEERRQSDVVRFLLRWAINHYHKLGSFAAMRGEPTENETVLYTNINKQFEEQFGEKLRANAQARLELRKQAQKELEAEVYDGSTAKPTKRSAR